MSRKEAPDTRARLIGAASELFAERGFHGTKARDIAARAGVNLAAGNYHYGSKKSLYLEVLRAQFAEIRALLVRRGASRSPTEIQRLARAEVEALLRVRANAMLELVIGPGLHATLMQREMTDPSEAMPVIVAEFIEPMMKEMEQLVKHLQPRLSDIAVQRCVFSVMGQVLFYRFARPALLQLLQLPAYPPGIAAALAEHITEFSLGGLVRSADRKRRRERRPRVRASTRQRAVAL